MISYSSPCTVGDVLDFLNEASSCSLGHADACSFCFDSTCCHASGCLLVEIKHFHQICLCVFLPWLSCKFLLFTYFLRLV